ncbi:MAG: radical SAM protein, partial [Clostridia bacterium]|nr:radical SAM protein [Clostridia bacterium]
MKNEYSDCKLCARRCSVNREIGELGACRSSEKIKIARAALHFWEEPCISGERGSGTIFFSGCSLSCIY